VSGRRSTDSGHAGGVLDAGRRPPDASAAPRGPAPGTSGAPVSPGGNRVRLTSRLAFRDLKDEALLSVCLVSAIAAVLAPIMVLAGLKYGFIEIMRSKLIQDPAFRLLTPVSAQNRGDKFFKALAARPGVAFVQPTVLQSGTQARIEVEATKQGESFELEPTGAGDPLILENEGAIPGPDEVTLSAPGAEALGVKEGDTVVVVAFRNLAGRREFQRVPLKVKSVLRVAADVQKRAYVGVDLVLDIERYKAGITVSSRGWIGVARPPEQAFDGVYLMLDEALNEVDAQSMATSLGFVEAKTVSPADFKTNTGLDGDGTVQILLLVNTSKPVPASQIASIPNRLGDRKFRMLPVASVLEVVPEGTETPIPGDAFDPAAFKLSLVKGDASRLPAWRADASYIQVERVLIPKKLAEAKSIEPGARLNLTLKPRSADDATQLLTIGVTVDGIVDGESILMPPALVGMLVRSRGVAMAYDAKLSTLLRSDIGFLSFRAYGRTIDDVPPIARALSKEGTEVRTKADNIEQLQRLDAALTRMTLIVALVALLGGSAVLIASFYAAVERKKGELSLLRLLGFSRGDIFSIPIMQSIMLAVAGFILALVLFFAFSELINSQYSSDLTLRGSICRLDISHIGIFALATFVIAILSSLIAANRTLQIDPAEALRQE
jgi:putative ABC transport system permease protein